MSEFFTHEPPARVERLARIEGQSNFLSLLAGIEAGPDTTEDMAASSFARFNHGVVPETLEVHIAKSDLFKWPLMSMVFTSIVANLERKGGKIKARDKPWMQGAVADAFLLLRDGKCKYHKDRAKQFRVDHEAYGAFRKLAESEFQSLKDDAETAWEEARFAFKVKNNQKSVM